MEFGVPRGDHFNWGDLARRSPISDAWGTDQACPSTVFSSKDFSTRIATTSRVAFSKSRIPGIRGCSETVLDSQVIDVDSRNPRATLAADLTCADAIAADQFDCFILTQTLHIIYDIRAALADALRMLKPAGVLLCTIPAVSRINYEDGGLETGDYWRLTGQPCNVCSAKSFPSIVSRSKRPAMSNSAPPFFLVLLPKTCPSKTWNSMILVPAGALHSGSEAAMSRFHKSPLRRILS